MKQTILVTCLLSLVMTGPVKVEVGDDWSDAAGYEECPEWVVANKTLPKPIEDICGVDLECAEAEVIDNADCGFGMVKILAGKWVSTKMLESEGDSKHNKAFMSLFLYISGANEDGAKIPMTAPVFIKTYMDSSFKEIGGSMHFYIPSAFQAKPPKPTDDKVYIEEWDDMLVYYRALGDKAAKIPGEIWVEEFTNLATALQRTGHSFYPYESLVAGFTSPWDRQQRTEILFTSAKN